MKRIALFVAILSVSVAAPIGCAHLSPSQFATCMKDSSAGAALINAVNDILDGDNRTAVLEQLSIVVGEDVLKCVLQQISSAKSTTPTGNERAKRAKEFLDAHGG